MANDVVGPLVFQCIDCRAIVGDSLGAVGVFRELDSVVVDRCTGMTQSLSITTTPGFTYRRLQCAKCEAAIGRAYLTAPQHFAAVIGAISLSIDRLNSYPLGMATDTAATMHLSPSLPPTSTESKARISSEAEEDLRAELVKMKAIILALKERVVTLETKTRHISSADQSTDDPKKRRAT
jgi:hypothetical protein